MRRAPVFARCKIKYDNVGPTREFNNWMCLSVCVVSFNQQGEFTFN